MREEGGGRSRGSASSLLLRLPPPSLPAPLPPGPTRGGGGRNEEEWRGELPLPSPLRGNLSLLAAVSERIAFIGWHVGC